jgi:hypothetical protein
MGTFQNTFSRSLGSQGSLLNQFPAPTPNDALFYLDGSITTVGSDKYFIDKKNGKNFLITGYDFDATWTKGFPYKSAATISAPSGDTALIAADINNFLYASNGTPNAIPVVSLFQDIDYEHKLFTRHVAQIVDGNGVETTEPYVAEIVLYLSARTSTDLTDCQTYYSVPTEDANAKWCSPATAIPAGNDANAGTKAAPDLTIAHSLSSENTGKRIYFKTQNPQAVSGVVVRSGNNHNMVAIGLVKLNGYDINYYFQLTNSLQSEFCGFIYECIDEQGRRVDLANTDKLKLNRNYFKGRGTTTGGFNMYAGRFNEATNNIFTGRFSQSGAKIRCDGNVTMPVLISGNYFGSSVEGTYSIYVLNCSQPITISHNKDVSILRAGGAPLNIAVDKSCTGSTLIRDNYIVSGGDSSINIDARGNRITSDYELEISYNRVIRNHVHYKGFEMLEHQINTPHVHHNYIETNVLDNRNCAISFHAGNMWAEYNIFKSTLNGSEGEDIDGEPLTGEILSAGLVNKINNNKIISNRYEQGHITCGGGSEADVADKIDVDVYNNVIKGYGTFNSSYGNAWGIGVQYQKDASIRYNFIKGVRVGISIQSFTAFTSEGVFYNLIINSLQGVYASGNGCDLNILNNTIVTNIAASTGLLCSNQAKCTFKNNLVILLGTGNNYGSVLVDANSVLDYNIYYCPNGTLLFTAPSQVNKTFAQWQALGYDTHSVVLTDAQFNALFSDFANGDYSLKDGSAAIGAGEALDAAYDDGLDSSTDWGDDTEYPTVITKQQGAAWDCGAYVH